MASFKSRVMVFGDSMSGVRHTRTVVNQDKSVKEMITAMLFPDDDVMREDKKYRTCYLMVSGRKDLESFTGKGTDQDNQIIKQTTDDILNLVRAAKDRGFKNIAVIPPYMDPISNNLISISLDLEGVRVLRFMPRKGEASEYGTLTASGRERLGKMMAEDKRKMKKGIKNDIQRYLFCHFGGSVQIDF